MLRTTTLASTVLVCGLAVGSAFAAAAVGARAPRFSVSSADDRELGSDAIKGKVAVIFYESRDAVEKNRKLKTGLNRHYESQDEATRKQIARVPVVDCSGAFWPFTAIWKSKLRENSALEKLTIFCDWNGSMKAAFQMKEDDSNVVVVDKAGVIRFSRSGQVSDADGDALRSLLEKLGQ